MKKIQLVEVGLRDGLQNTYPCLSLQDRYKLVQALSQSGLKRIELGSFVSPKAIPQMQCTLPLVKKTLSQQAKGKLPKNISYSAFIPNQKGFSNAIQSGLKELSYFISCTESFSQVNINMSIKDSFKDLKKICRQAQDLKIKIRVYLSVAFSCPYEGPVSTARVVTLAEKIMQENVFELSISDTIGVAVYSDVIKLLNKVLQKVPVKKIGMHFHDTRGNGLGNILAGLQTGVRVFDSSIGGLGGCPYIPNTSSSGNIATEDATYMLESMGFQTNIQIQKLIQTTKLLEKQLNTSLSSKLSVAGLPKIHKAPKNKKTLKQLSKKK